MKTNVFTLALLILAFTPCYSQTIIKTGSETGCIASTEEIRRKPVLGFKLGLNRSNVYDEGAEHFIASPRTGAAVGAWVAIPLGTYLGLQPEFMVSQKGFEASGMVGTQLYDLTRTTTYIDVPLQLQFKPFSWVTLLGGVQYSYLVRQHDVFVVDNNYESVTQAFTNDNLRRNLLGVVTGADLNFWHLVLSARAGWDLIANRGDGTSLTPRYKNLWLQGTIGYRLF